ncbi:hypothetical protein [Wielerella bovis]|uniref:hypothetical protein n=1 Tax=Wielerella bovis TaxID=2917790 RepID=UPI00201935BC|nr:hypothetical protein [Wielerella bovis]ULJ61309.1 hypothetical protein MIS44_05550 [Wielerella bovis]
MEMEDEIQLLNKSLVRSFGDGLNWLNQSWYLLKSRLGKWLLIGILFLLIGIAVNLALGFMAESLNIPFVFDFISTILGTFLSAGLILAIASHAENDDLEIAYLFSGFQQPVKNIILLAVVLYIPFLLETLLVSAETSLFIKFGLLVLSFSMWFMTPLVVLHDINPFSAFKMSVLGSLKNIAPFICFSLSIGLVIMGLIFAMFVFFGVSISTFSIDAISSGQLEVLIMLLIGFLLTILVILFIFMANYVSYRNVWTTHQMK